MSSNPAPKISNDRREKNRLAQQRRRMRVREQQAQQTRQRQSGDEHSNSNGLDTHSLDHSNFDLDSLTPDPLAVPDPFPSLTATHSAGSGMGMGVGLGDASNGTASMNTYPFPQDFFGFARGVGGPNPASVSQGDNWLQSVAQNSRANQIAATPGQLDDSSTIAAAGLADRVRGRNPSMSKLAISRGDVKLTSDILPDTWTRAQRTGSTSTTASKPPSIRQASSSHHSRQPSADSRGTSNSSSYSSYPSPVEAARDPMRPSETRRRPYRAKMDSAVPAGRTPLHMLCETGDKEMIVRAIRAGANTLAFDELGMTPLHVAARGGNNDAISSLLDCRVPIDGKDKNGWTPLHHAAWCGFKETVRLLVQRGACLDAVAHPDEVVDNS